MVTVLQLTALAHLANRVSMVTPTESCSSVCLASSTGTFGSARGASQESMMWSYRQRPTAKKGHVAPNLHLIAPAWAVPRGGSHMVRPCAPARGAGADDTAVGPGLAPCRAKSCPRRRRQKLWIRRMAAARAPA